jgi:hypothetical protein
MKTPFQAGQIVRFKNYNPKENEAEAYFVVIIPEDAAKNCWIQVINTNRYYGTGYSLSPTDVNDLELVQLTAKELMHQEVTIRDGLFHEIVFGIVHSASEPEAQVVFTEIQDGFESNITFTMSYEILNGKLQIGMPDEILVKR